MTADTTVKEDLTPETAPPVLTRDAYLAQVQDAQEASAALQDSMRQSEWVAACRALQMTRTEIQTDPAMRLVVLAWVKAHRNLQGVPWQTFLDMTDNELLDLHGYPTRMPDDFGDVPAITYATPEAVTEEAHAKANFCLRLGVAPSEFDALTDAERRAFIAEYDAIRAAYAAGGSDA